jgi:hypothetical protein
MNFKSGTKYKNGDIKITAKTRNDIAETQMTPSQILKIRSNFFSGLE